MKLPFLRKSADREPLVVSMTGVRLGEQAIYCGASTPRLVALAARTGLSGRVAVLPVDQTDESQSLEASATREGVLVESLRSSDDVDQAAFDLAVLDLASVGRRPPDLSGTITTLTGALRAGGRFILIEGGTPHGLRAHLPFADARPTGSAADELARHVSRVRAIGERDGLRFLEGFNTGPRD
jgi:hypothetical protein